jgi:uncharacterized protein
MRKFLPAAIAAATLVAPAAAPAHVTLQPSEAPAGGFTRLDVRVPNERDEAATTKVQLQLPDGFAFASYEPAPGWRVDVQKGKLSEPVKTHGGEITDGVKLITWTSKQGIPAGAFQDFGLSVRLPGKAGDRLTFKAVQTYGNGEAVRWIGPAGSDNPAPQVTLTAAEDDHGAAPAAAPAAATTNDDSGGSDGLAIAALVFGALGLVAGGAALVANRRRPA